MAKGTVNKVILIGRLGSNPEVRYTPSGTAVANFNIATNRNRKDRDGNWQTETDWHRIVLWERQAELAKEYLKKGSRIYVEGRLQTRDWEDQNGQKRFMTEVVGNNIEILDSGMGQSGGDMPGSGFSASASPPPPPPAPSQQEPDDVPF